MSTTTTDPRTGCQVGTVTRETVTRVMYRCRTCKSARRVDVPTVVEHNYFNRWNHATGTASQGLNTFRYYGPHKSAYLPQAPLCCDRLMRGEPIVGVQNDAVKCDARCTNAKGHNCECSCGGKNHGINHTL